MAEIHLTCPKCATSYRLPPSAIPEQGRDVECSACGHAWLALVPDPGDDSDNAGTEPPAATVFRHESDRPSPDRKEVTGPGDMPELNRRLPDNVLNILREEVEFEHQARRGEIPREAPPSPDTEWPATTVTTPAEEPSNPAPPQLTEPQVVTPEEPAIIPAPAMSRDPASLSSLQEAAHPATSTVAHPKRRQRKRTGYLAGFGIALIGAAAALVLYVQAPALSSMGPLGEELHELRQKVDAGRHWLDQRVSSMMERG